MRRFIDLVEQASTFTVVEMDDQQLSRRLGGKEFRQRFRYVYLGQGEVHLVALRGKVILGIASVEQNPHDRKELWIKHVSVDPQFQGEGVATALLEHCYIYAVEHGLLVSPSSFTEQGQRLKALMMRLNAKYPEADNGQPFRDM